ncbi:sulfotransferase family 2 domain-containing protein [Novosphingobium sp. MBES04]|uniref:sulfotransferase family 2 domain-containing protein n=1 Tax=Novosphingobium sp. MBES04 TaxID=1206458 RepID=UPI00057EE348|nr:sulfotransferase family 2 domain-containing protein [Novosphingobium sp. MBES04]GAM05345.1 transposase [Novosphingobium sp. MBES04]
MFYHVYKVAGSSIRNALIPHARKSQVAAQYVNHILTVARLPRSSNPLFAYHPRMADVKKKMGNEFYEYYRFGFVRNPMDWQKSLYFFMMKKTHLPGHKNVVGKSFDEYLNWRMEHEMRHQTDFIYDGDECLLDDIFHFENINEGFAQAASKIGIDGELPHLNKAGKGKSVEVSRDTLDRFLDLHRTEYDRLGYSLDSDFRKYS